MANLIKNNSTQGLYITEEEDGQIANNTPGEIDLDNLALGDKYIYFDTLLRFEEKTTFNREDPDWIGFKTLQVGDLNVRASTGGGMRTFYMCTVETNVATAQYLKTLGALNVIAADGLKYIVKQTASEVFELFPNSSGVNKKAIAIIIRGFDIVEVEGKDLKLINIACERVISRG